MTEKLREEYVAFLAEHDLHPRAIPSNRDAIEAAVMEHLKAQSKASGNPGDEFIGNWYDTWYQENREQIQQEIKHGATFLIETAAAEVEQSIRTIERYRGSRKVDVFAGEFPTGSINAQAVKVDSGFLLLINSGLLIMVQQVVEYLIQGDPDNAKDREVNATAIDGVVAVLEAYLRFGDPFFGPKPMSGGGMMILRHVLVHATQVFVVAHEYGHVIGGHLDGQLMRLEQLTTRVGTINVIKKDWIQEFEADVIAHKILLGVEDYASLDLSILSQADDLIKQANYLDKSSGSVLFRALELKARLAAPFIFFTIDAILSDVQKAVRIVKGVVQPYDDTHPPARERMDKLIAGYKALKPEHTGFIHFAAILWAHIDEINLRLGRALL
jgi:hypothetical protein